MTLDLSYNWLEEGGETALDGAFERNTTLEMLDWSCSYAMGDMDELALEAAHAKRRVVALVSASFVRGPSAARRLTDNDGDHAVARRVLGFLL